ncbi:glucan endo-1,3-beta-glucosidase precursor [Pseudozyma hubeiensis SY62]|uniref:Glucan endo-1,3-beta-glucosidase n=1 Tax=Pseudozyma hubeiensis (strain SY62) TaxID=1305764 RepID=R9NX16_PSEHS|nr:glucan endo-1,3-beta-glucosidase precursor [Pseudozyma hubeiensis SY62]GAC93091.1 glucan endo-1,3-beta-glucosidase precursor [Pseudozyma hubeiensis SY62]
MMRRSKDALGSARVLVERKRSEASKPPQSSSQARRPFHRCHKRGRNILAASPFCSITIRITQRHPRSRHPAVLELGSSPSRCSDQLALPKHCGRSSPRK